MCKLFPLFMSFVALQWTAAEPTLVPTGNHTQDDALYKSAHAPHPKIDESDTPRILGPRNPAGSEDDHVHLNSEERISLSTLFELDDIKSLASRVGKFSPPGRDIYPAGAQMDSEALPEDLKTSMSCLQSLVDRYSLTVGTHTSNAAVKDPEYSYKSLVKAVATLVRYRDVDGTNEITHSMLRALAVRNDNAGALMRNACQDAGVSPEEFFYMLPISEDLKERGFKEPAAYPVIFYNLEHWLIYVHYTNVRRLRKALHTAKVGKLSFVDNRFEPESFFVDTLVKEGKAENVGAFLEYLRGITVSADFARVAARHLLADHPDVAETMMLTWASKDLGESIAHSWNPWGKDLRSD
ncbi:unnamed protein product [Hyaloperonospora brassicae]|uniref:RxLR effector candidate protein n=1 Tax=Hyaloperonospora brassicae TaxID=162125 RepID=A0AAV0TEX7_HYABA|nr:unnamed protein product [Hyaloperonospora brassicae]